MRLIRQPCPDPIGDVGVHHHWSIKTKNHQLHWGGFWDYDHVNFGVPVELIWVRMRKDGSGIYRYFRPFDKGKRTFKRVR